MNRLAGNAALITGGGTGIGRATARLFAAEGAAVAVLGRREAPLEDVVQDIETGGGKALACPADVTDEAAILEIVHSIESELGPLAIVVNNAGTVRRGEDITRTDVTEWNGDVATNLTGVFLVVKHTLPLLVRHGGGSIINIASQIALAGAPGYATYAASKGGVISLTRTLAVEYGSHGVRCNCICPGVVETEMAYVGRPDFEERKDRIAQTLPLRRVGQPEDVAQAALYLASTASAWVTGAVLPVDGGFTAQ